MKLSHLNALRAVEAVSRLGSIRAAADEMGITSAAVGQRIRTLEDFLGQPLFHRRPTGVEPADITRRLAPQLNSSMYALSQVLEEMQSSKDGARVAVAMTQSLAENWLSQELPGFFTAMPGVDLRIDTSARIVDLHDGTYDFAIRHLRAPDEGLESLRLFPNGVVPVCTPDFAKRYGLSRDRISLEGVPLCHIQGNTSDPRWLDWQGWCEEFGVRFPGDSLPYVSRFSGGLRIARARLGIILGGLVESLPMLREGNLLMPFGPESAVYGEYSFWLVWVEGRNLSKAQGTFRSWVAARAEAVRADLDTLIPQSPR